MAHLFIGTLKGVAFEWFMKLPAGSIKKWADLVKLFLARFFEDDQRSIHANFLYYKVKEKRVNQSVCGEILEYGALMS